MATAELDEALVFDVARRIDAPESRLLYLQQVCAEYPKLRARVEALLRVHDDDRGFLEDSAEERRARAVVLVSEGAGTQIGPYKLLEQIGEGGFGVVFMAEQQRPVRRIVALKVLKPGMDSRQVVARFEAERQALALMDHPNIAHVLDGGETISRRPYFVMDLVKGLPITRYCDLQQVTARERLALFVPLCQALQHAHQKGIIHRDIKPSNVLVAAHDGKPVPTVIDFGVAKALGQRLSEQTLATGIGGIIGTLEYMSPEQAEFNALDVDTRADIYSLGVVLYELLTGTTPLTRERLNQLPVTEALRLIREEEPSRPSARLSELKGSPASISGQRKLEPARLTRELRGDLDWIVMKALEKDRARRYQTANGLARDIERYLNDEAVEACPPTRVYKLRKFARKNRKLLAAAAAFALLLTAATAVSSWLAIRATLAERATGRERDRAEAWANRARRQVYDAHMKLGESAWEDARVGRLGALLDQHGPGSGDDDLRGFEWHYWRRMNDCALLTLNGHSNTVLCVAFSPDGKRLASASYDGTLRVWDAVGGRELWTVKPHGRQAYSVAFSPDGKQLASTGQDLTIKIWDLPTGENLRTLKGHTNVVAALAFSPDGKQLASASHDQSVKLWDMVNGREMLTLKGHDALVMSVAFSPDGKRLASGSKDKTIRLWDAAGGLGTRIARGHTDEVMSVAFSADGKRLASASLDRTVRIWDAASGQEIRALTGHADRVFGVAFSPDGKRIASASFDQTIKLWDAASGHEALTLKGHTSWVSSVVFSPHGNRLASASADKTVKVWDAFTGDGATMGTEERGPVLRVEFSPDGTRLATVNAVVQLYDAASGVEILTLHGHTQPATTVAFSADGKRLASASADKTVKVWDAASGRELLTLEAPNGWVRSVAFSPDGKRLALAGEWKTVTVSDTATGQDVLTLAGHTESILSVAFSPDGKRLASASDDGTVKVWDTASGHETLTLKGHTRPVKCVVFSFDGNRLASASEDKTARIWDAKSGQEILTLAGHTNWVSSVAFSPDGKRLASASGDRMVMVWDTVSGEETLAFKKHTGLVSCVTFSPDGARLASASFDRTVRIWDARPWTPQLRLEQEARNLVHHLRATVGSRAAVVKRIEEYNGLEAAVRQEALAITGRWREYADRLNVKSWHAVVNGHAPPETYALALYQAEGACRLEPSNVNYIDTFGVALYRTDKLQESVETLTRADKLYSAQSTGRQPSTVAFLAMAQFKLGQKARARAFLAEASQLMKLSQWSDNDQNQSFLREATELIEGER